MTEINYWLMKSEPDVYGIHDLKKELTTLWDGIRNYQARNYMRTMCIGDQVFFYHSNCKSPGITGFMKVIETGIIDPTQFNPESKYYDQKSSKANPRWDCVKLKYVGTFYNFLTLKEIKDNYSEKELAIVRKGNRLSIIPISQKIAIDMLNKLGELR